MLPPFGWGEVLTHWAFSPVVTVLTVVAAVLYLEGAWRVARRHPARPWPWWRTAMFLGGLAVIVLATESGIGAYENVLFWVHMVQHLMLIMVAPALLVAGQPVTLLMHASHNPLHTWVKRAVRSRIVTWLTCPAFGAAAYAATITGTHLTGLMNVIMTNSAARAGEHVLYLVVGYLFFLPLLGREPIKWRLSYPVRLLVLFLTMPVDTFTGLVLGYSNTPMAGMSPRPSWAPSAVSDLHSGGAVMWIGGDAIMFALMMLVFLAWSRDDRASAGGGWLESARRASFASLTGAGEPRQPVTRPAGGHRNDEGTIDDDEHLAAYNEFLARINGARPADRTTARQPGQATPPPNGTGDLHGTGDLPAGVSTHSVLWGAPRGDAERHQHEQQERDDVHARAPQADEAHLEELDVDQVKDEPDADDHRGQPDQGDLAPA
jgi:cytochrome c oxidase assembly factor CtaG